MDLDCMRCGACCFSESDRHARVTGDDYARLGDRAEELVVFIGNQAFMRVERRGGVGRCIALATDGAGGFACAIYEQRPAVCRELGRGSPACEAERLLKLGRTQKLLVTPPS